MARKPAEEVEDEKLLVTVEQHPVALTEKEMLAYGQRLAQQEQQLSDHHEHAEGIRKALKAKESAIQAERSRLALSIRDKAEIRDVKVTVWRNVGTKHLFHIREDTGEETYRRHLRNEELQTDAFEGIGPDGLKLKN